ncbi:MAG: AsmA family protein [Chloroflexi bacterium]|nr:AsmA family protein [Chloroflexota bacterium]
MPASAPHTFWRQGRRWLRGFRICLLLFVLSLAGLLLYLNWIGLPGFVKAKLVTELRRHGLDLEFSRLRLQGYRHFLAENIRFGSAKDPDGPELFIKEAELLLNREALKRLQFDVDALLIRQARFGWPLPATNQVTRRLRLTDISTELSLRERDRWEISRFEARCFGASLHLFASVTNASAIRRWPRPGPSAGPTTGLWQSQLNRFVSTLEQMQFKTPPELTLIIRGDARDRTSFGARLKLSAAQALTPWGQWDNITLASELTPVTPQAGEMKASLALKLGQAQTPWGEFRKCALTGEATVAATNQVLSSADGRIELGEARTRWGTVHNLRLIAHSVPQPAEAAQFLTTLNLNSDALRTEWGQAKDGLFTAQLAHSWAEVKSLWATLQESSVASSNSFSAASLSNKKTAQARRGAEAGPGWGFQRGEWELVLRQIEGLSGKSDGARFRGRCTRRPEESQVNSDPAWGWWMRLAPYDLDWEAELSRYQSPQLQIEQASATGQWRFPRLTLQKLQASLYRGHLEATGGLRVDTRTAEAQAKMDLDLQQIAPLLGTNTQRWLSQFSWESPPEINARAALVLPAWTNAHPNWRQEVWPTLGVEGDFAGTNGAFRQIQVAAASSHFSFTNFVWRLPDLSVRRPEGQLQLAYTGDTRTREYHFVIDSGLDLNALKPALDKGPQKVLDYFEFGEPPLVQGEIWGRWFAPELIGFAGRVAAANFVFRGERCSDFSAAVRYTNSLFHLAGVQIRRDDQRINAPEVTVDVKQQVVDVTNAVSTMDPHLAAKVIGPKVLKAITPYKFAVPPVVQVNGRLPIVDEADADVTFELQGGGFSYWRFNVPRIAARLHWRGETLSISNLQADFYGGHLDWEGGFDFTRHHGADYHFKGTVTETDLQLLMADLVTSTNQLEGVLNGHLEIVSANSEDWQSWRGHGKADLRDGFLWNIPIFGIFSPLLNAVSPGLGSSKASAGSATFTIVNSIIHTKDMQVRARGVRLHYDGTVDFQGNLNARMEAQLLRDTWILGRLFSLAFWPLTKLFEYKIGGTLSHPKTDLLYFPKFLMLPLQPFQTLKGLFPESKTGPEEIRPKEAPRP